MKDQRFEMVCLIILMIAAAFIILTVIISFAVIAAIVVFGRLITTGIIVPYSRSFDSSTPYCRIASAVIVSCIYISGIPAVADISLFAFVTFVFAIFSYMCLVWKVRFWSVHDHFIGIV